MGHKRFKAESLISSIKFEQIKKQKTMTGKAVLFSDLSPASESLARPWLGRGTACCQTVQAEACASSFK